MNTAKRGERAKTLSGRSRVTEERTKRLTPALEKKAQYCMIFKVSYSYEMRAFKYRKAVI